MRKTKVSRPPRSKLLTSKDKYENSFWMEELPAHVWVQDEKNSVVFSNRLPPGQPAAGESAYNLGEKISCCKAFMGKKSSCPCCPYQRVTSTLQPESCMCRRGREIHQVYHFPFAPLGGYHWELPLYVLKIEINAGDLRDNGNKAGGVGSAKAAGVAEQTPAGRLVMICSACKKVRDQAGSWRRLENYFKARHGVKFSHGLCGECACRLYPEIWRGKP